jgi:hypothetical protein
MGTETTAHPTAARTDNQGVHALGPFGANGRTGFSFQPRSIERAGSFSGSRTVDVAQELGIDQWRADRWPNLMCACFVSSMLRSAGYLAFNPNVHVYPADVERAALETGWQPIDASRAGPGDLAIMPTRGASGHIELVSHRHRSGLVLLGSNNIHGEQNPQFIGEELAPHETLPTMRFYRPPV